MASSPGWTGSEGTQVMSRLVKQVKGKGKAATASRDVPAVPSSMQPRSMAGHVIDGVPYPLQGEPPVATSKGWGDMSWWYWSRR
jgi:hypothetical protein